MMRTDTDEEISPADEGFGTRWSRRKLETQKQQQELNNESQTESLDDKPVLTDADMPPIESLNEESDYSGFLSPEVSDGLRKQALRKLFLGSGFNVCDGLDDYDEDYTSFAKLGDIVTADMRHQMEMEARKQLALDQGQDSRVQDPVNEQILNQEQETNTTAAEENLPEQQLMAHRSSEEIEDDLEQGEL